MPHPVDAENDGNVESGEGQALPKSIRPTPTSKKTSSVTLRRSTRASNVGGDRSMVEGGASKVSDTTSLPYTEGIETLLQTKSVSGRPLQDNENDDDVEMGGQKVPENKWLEQVGSSLQTAKTRGGGAFDSRRAWRGGEGSEEFSSGLGSLASMASTPSRAPIGLPQLGLQRQVPFSITDLSLRPEKPTTWDDIQEGDKLKSSLLREQTTARSEANYAIERLRSVRLAMREEGMVPEFDRWEV